MSGGSTDTDTSAVTVVAITLPSSRTAATATPLAQWDSASRNAPALTLNGTRCLRNGSEDRPRGPRNKSLASRAGHNDINGCASEKPVFKPVPEDLDAPSLVLFFVRDGATELFRRGNGRGAVGAGERQ